MADAPPAQAPAAPGETVLQVEELSTPRRQWRLVLMAPGLRLDPPTLQQPLHVPLAGFTGYASIDENRKRLVLKRPGKHVFQLDEASFRALQAWLGPALLLKLALRSRFVWAVPIGAIWMVTSVPLGCEKLLGDKPPPVEPFGLVMGVVLFVLGFAAQARPHRVFFLLDSVWFIAMAADTAMKVVVGRDSPWWLIIVFFCLTFVWAGVKSFRRFGPAGTGAASPG